MQGSTPFCPTLSQVCSPPALLLCLLFCLKAFMLKSPMISKLPGTKITFCPNFIYPVNNIWESTALSLQVFLSVACRLMRHQPYLALVLISPVGSELLHLPPSLTAPGTLDLIRPGETLDLRSFCHCTANSIPGESQLCVVSFFCHCGRLLSPWLVQAQTKSLSPFPFCCLPHANADTFKSQSQFFYNFPSC